MRDLRRFSCAVFILGFAVTTGHAETSAVSEDKPIPQNEPVKKFHFEEVTLFKNDEMVERGDSMRIERDFGSWVLKCQWRPSHNKRICSPEQRMWHPSVQIQWRVAQSVDGQPYVVIATNEAYKADDSFTLGFSEFQKNIKKDDWYCIDKGCLTAFPFVGLVQAAILNTDSVTFKLNVSNQPIGFDAPIDGLLDSLKAAAEDPFARNVQIAKPEKKGEAETKKAASVVKPLPKVQPSKQNANKPPVTQKGTDKAVKRENVVNLNAERKQGLY